MSMQIQTNYVIQEFGLNSSDMWYILMVHHIHQVIIVVHFIWQVWLLGVGDLGLIS